MGRAILFTETAFKSPPASALMSRAAWAAAHRVCVGKVHRQGEGIDDIAAVSTHPAGYYAVSSAIGFAQCRGDLDALRCGIPSLRLLSLFLP